MSAEPLPSRDRLPHLFAARPRAQQAVLVGVVPFVFGVLCGWIAGVSEVLYTILTVPVALPATVFAGFEHRGARDGALRGAVAGAVFGLGIVLARTVIGGDSEVSLPHPLIVLAVATSIAASLAAALGGHWREAAERGRVFDHTAISRSEALGMAAGALLVASMFLPWFTTSDTNPNSHLAGKSGGAGVSAWEVFHTLDIALVLGASVPFVLTWILGRGHELSWKPGEWSLVNGATVFVLILCNGVILGRPGESVEIGLGYGYFVALLAAAGLIAAGYARQAMYTSVRKPPGVL
ncbi:MAG TPA: hypothetical protein VGJ32_09970 [Solirubrobacteraceae bacterium]|jgi:hypothetical protein